MGCSGPLGYSAGEFIAPAVATRGGRGVGKLVIDSLMVPPPQPGGGKRNSSVMAAWRFNTAAMASGCFMSIEERDHRNAISFICDMIPLSHPHLLPLSSYSVASSPFLSLSVCVCVRGAALPACTGVPVAHVGSDGLHSRGDLRLWLLPPNRCNDLLDV